MYAGPSPAGRLEVCSSRVHECTDAGTAKICHVIVYLQPSVDPLGSGCQWTGATDGANGQMRRELGKGREKQCHHFEEL